MRILQCAITALLFVAIVGVAMLAVLVLTMTLNHYIFPGAGILFIAWFGAFVMFTLEKPDAD